MAEYHFDWLEEDTRLRYENMRTPTGKTYEQVRDELSTKAFEGATLGSLLSHAEDNRV